MTNSVQPSFDLRSLLLGSSTVIIGAAVLGMIHDYDDRYISSFYNLSEEANKVINRAKLKENRPPYIPEKEEPTRVGAPRRRATPLSRRIREVGPLVVVLDRYKDTFSVFLYENLPGWKRRRVARATGLLTHGEAEKKFDEVVDAAMQARFEKKFPHLAK